MAEIPKESQASPERVDSSVAKAVDAVIEAVRRTVFNMNRRRPNPFYPKQSYGKTDAQQQEEQRRGERPTSLTARKMKQKLRNGLPLR